MVNLSLKGFYQSDPIVDYQTIQTLQIMQIALGYTFCASKPGGLGLKGRLADPPDTPDHADCPRVHVLSVKTWRPGP